MSIPNDELEQLVKQLNGKNKVVAISFLSWLLEKQADEEDVILTAEDIEAIEQTRQELRDGQTISLEDLKRELQL
jgi:regulatory protein YycI of two-component signal transduction system YycFG